MCPLLQVLGFRLLPTGEVLFFVVGRDLSTFRHLLLLLLYWRWFGRLKLLYLLLGDHLLLYWRWFGRLRLLYLLLGDLLLLYCRWFGRLEFLFLFLGDLLLDLLVTLVQLSKPAFRLLFLCSSFTDPFFLVHLFAYQSQVFLLVLLSLLLPLLELPLAQ